MAWTIIVATSDWAQFDALDDAAQRIRSYLPEGNHRIFHARSVADAEELRKKAPDSQNELVIVTASLADGRPDTPAAEYPGLDLVNTLQALEVPPACIVVSEHVEHYAAVERMKRCALLLVDTNTEYEGQSLQLARKLGVIPEPLAAAKPARVSRRKEAPGSAAQPAAGRSGDASASPATAVAGAAAPGGGPPAEPPGDAPASVVTAVAAAAGVVAAAAAVRADKYAWIDIFLPDRAENTTVQLDVRHPTEPIKAPPAPHPLRQADVDDVVQESRRLRDDLSAALKKPDLWDKYQPTWELRYRALGARIYDLLLQGTVRDHYFLAMGKVESPNVRVRFNLHPSVFDGLWESIFDAQADRYLMLENMLARRAMQRYDRFKDQLEGGGVLNILVIRSDVPENSTPKGPKDPLWAKYLKEVGPHLPALNQLDREMKVLTSLEDQPRAPRVEVEVLPAKRPPLKPWSLEDVVKKKLQAEPGRYDVVHFAGHALFAPGEKFADDRGYLVFSGFPAPTAVPIAEVADWLKGSGVQLVYLSCCRSSAARAAIEFADNGLPMSIGFTWDLDDSKAVDFAELFYGELLSGASLRVCPAFVAARRKLEKRYRKADPIWASPILVAQPMDLIHVEGMLRLPQRAAVARNSAPRGRSKRGGGAPRSSAA
jgi:hypothetical protein